ncbi:hypothetical protein TcG_01923 [Trypanosoma cruzi]|uniref:Uncharacterized protein n=1 Tax=Trypanosoma cruzi TaxID=5693 RepID=A0A2V2UQH2_TRYCR|nr:hypothetical protein TcBrA4_0090770 [Trypanosoma cruzi]PWU86475.1 hypothetical protein C4B63_120g40 [Trypanosoma cruzi]RNF22996.1 hypothetical protein TcG_01923 [Trypanosoma cruzi]
MWETRLISPPRRSLSAPCATIRHVCSFSADEDVERELRAEVVEAASSLFNPRLRITRAAFLFPSFTASVSSSGETTKGTDAWQALLNSRVCGRKEVVGEPILFDRLRTANSQINLLNSMSGYTLQRCAELEEENMSLSRTLKQLLDENRQLSERLQSCLRELYDERKLVAVLQSELEASQHEKSAREVSK